MEYDYEGTTLYACLIAAAQRAEHYEMAAYGTLVAWARAMGHDKAVGLLEDILEEEKAADEKLTTIAESGINSEAASQAHPDGDQEKEDEAEMAGAGARGSRSTSRGSRAVTNGRGRAMSMR